MRLKRKFKVLLIIIILFIMGIVFCYNYDFFKIPVNHKLTQSIEKIKKPNIKQQKEYKLCINTDNPESVQEMNNIATRINKELSQYNVSVKYYDLSTNYSFTSNGEKIYYGASLIKSLDALYLYEKAANKDISLDDTLTYKKINTTVAKQGLGARKVGDEISIRDLVNYAITYSDNTAHQMLVSYIGFNELKEYGNSLGTKLTLIGGDNFGNTTVDDQIIIMNETYNYIEQNGELGKELLSFYNNDLYNYLLINDRDIVVAYKYGSYSSFFHNSGIVYDSFPYTISVLTQEKNRDEQAIIEEISNSIFQFHTIYHNSVNVKCFKKIYT